MTAYNGRANAISMDTQEGLGHLDVNNPIRFWSDDETRHPSLYGIDDERLETGDLPRRSRVPYEITHIDFDQMTTIGMVPQLNPMAHHDKVSIEAAMIGGL